MAKEKSEQDSPIDALLHAFKERLGSPFFGALIIAWTIFNWRGVVYLVVDNSAIIERMNFADINYFTSWSVAWGPLITAIIYLLLSPWMAAIVRVYRSQPQLIADKNHLRGLKHLSDAQREINDPGGLDLELKKKKQDLELVSENLKQLRHSEEAQKVSIQDRAARANNDLTEIRTKITETQAELDNLRTQRAESEKARRQLEADVQKMSEALKELKDADANLGVREKLPLLVRELIHVARKQGMSAREMAKVLDRAKITNEASDSAALGFLEPFEKGRSSFDWSQTFDSVRDPAEPKE